NIQERDERPQKSTSRRNGRRKSSKKTISASPTRSQIVVTNANVALTDPSEVAFNVCCLCVYCPLCILWCCIKLPFFCFAKNVNFIKDKSGCGRSLSMRIKDADYSSFLDIDLDEVKYKAHSRLKLNG
ncbi:hypothetical protein IGI04_029661, partial [Brassica rapa subsp. trilocularis]